MPFVKFDERDFTRRVADRSVKCYRLTRAQRKALGFSRFRSASITRWRLSTLCEVQLARRSVLTTLDWHTHIDVFARQSIGILVCRLLSPEVVKKNKYSLAADGPRSRRHLVLCMNGTQTSMNSLLVTYLNVGKWPKALEGSRGRNGRKIYPSFFITTIVFQVLSHIYFKIAVSDTRQFMAFTGPEVDMEVMGHTVSNKLWIEFDF